MGRKLRVRRGAMSVSPASSEGSPSATFFLSAERGSSLTGHVSLAQRLKTVGRRPEVIVTGALLLAALVIAIPLITASRNSSATPSPPTAENSVPVGGNSTAGVGSAGPPDLSTPTPSLALYSYEIINSYPHDPTAFTQGLFYFGNDTLYESTGMYGKSTVRKVALTSGTVEKETLCSSDVFGEGLALFGDRLLQVAWQTTKGFIYDLATLRKTGQFQHGMTDGWGLTSNGSLLLGTDGSPTLYFMDPSSFAVVESREVKDGDRPVRYLNELEFINGHLWANIWQTECIARISPWTGRVTAWLLMYGLRADAAKASNGGPLDVLNGIAWDSEKGRFFVTGKYWPKLYEVKLKEIANPTAKEIEDARIRCSI